MVKMQDAFAAWVQVMLARNVDAIRHLNDGP